MIRNYPIKTKVDGKEYYEISTATDLYWFAEQVNNTKTNQINAFLTNDIVVNEGEISVYSMSKEVQDQNSEAVRDWTPIGYYNSEDDKMYYEGIFDGQGHSIIGLYFNDSKKSYVGLFGAVGKDGVVKNLIVENSHFRGKHYVGTIVGQNFGIVENCSSEGDICGTGNPLGGIIGSNQKGQIKNCINSGPVRRTVTDPGAIIGGVVGYNVEGKIENCSNTGSVSTERTYSQIQQNDQVGGIIGCNNGGTVENCENSGEIRGNEHVGGIVGSLFTAQINYCCNTGQVNIHICSSVSQYAGGIVGYCSFKNTVENCINKGKINGGHYLGGIIGWNDGRIKNCKNEGEVIGSSLIGGIVGYIQSGSLENCSNVAQVNRIVNDKEKTGWIAGQAYGGEIIRCYYLKTSEINTNVNLIGKKTSKCYVVEASNDQYNETKKNIWKQDIKIRTFKKSYEIKKQVSYDEIEKIRQEIIELNNQIQEKSMKINEIRKDIQKSKYITIIIMIIIIMIFFFK